MKNKNINHRLEQLINKISVSEGKRKYIKNQTRYFTRHLKSVSSEPLRVYFTSYPINLDMKMIQFHYGGSFDRHLLTDEGYDVDIYLVYAYKQDPLYIPKHDNISAGQLFVMLRNHLETFSADYDVALEILEDFPYGHALPIRIDFDGQSSYFDCIPAIDRRNGFLLAPNAKGSVKVVNPNLDLNALSKLNKTQNGKITKLILLLKYWNFNWGKPLKSYVVERLVERIFHKANIVSWRESLEIFFREAVKILEKNIVIPDRVYANRSILDDYSEDTLDEFYEALNEGLSYLESEMWDDLFDVF